MFILYVQDNETGIKAIVGLQWSSKYEGYVTTTWYESDVAAELACKAKDDQATRKGWSRVYTFGVAPETVDGRTFYCIGVKSDTPYL